MIINLLIGLGYSVLNLFFSVLPDATLLPSEAMNAALYVGSYVGVFSGIIPFAVLGQAVGYVLVFEVLLFGFRAFVFLWSKIPFIGK